MAQNTSTAVMQRRVEPHDSLDDFPTPPWATRALCEHVLPDTSGLRCWEPACNRGHMARPLAEYFISVHASDIHDYSAENPGQDRICDFLFPGSEPPSIAAKGVDWIITNPPFRLAEQFALRALELAREGVALFVRSAFLEGCGRHDRLFRDYPPTIVAQFCERVPLVKGRYDHKASTATSYCWLVWTKGESDTRFVWIPPCRKDLERTGDWSAATCHTATTRERKPANDQRD